MEQDKNQLVIGQEEVQKIVPGSIILMKDRKIYVVTSCNGRGCMVQDTLGQFHISGDTMVNDIVRCVNLDELKLYSDYAVQFSRRSVETNRQPTRN